MINNYASLRKSYSRIFQSCINLKLVEINSLVFSRTLTVGRKFHSFKNSNSFFGKPFEISIYSTNAV